MTYQVTSKQYAAVHAAVARAQEPGACMYAKDDAPCCVIGQLATLEGVSLRTLQTWDERAESEDGKKWNAGIESIIETGHLPAPLAAYPQRLLLDLQRVWDSPNVHFAYTDTDSDESVREALAHWVRVNCEVVP